MMAYGQHAITEDLYAAREAVGGQVIDQAGNVQLHELTSSRPYVTYEKEASNQQIDCDYIAGCDGYHGVSRPSISASVLRTYEKSYPFGWLGILSETPPFPDVCYCYHRRGFALASMRNPMLSRYYIQCDLEAKLEDWPDDRFWGEFKARCPKDMADSIVTGPSIEKSIAPCTASSPSRCGTAGCSWPATPPTSSPRPGQRALTLRSRTCSICPER
jgi:p-hydroxybenzoate 3-monooxygenase